jgi:folate-binding protein YgfZ
VGDVPDLFWVRVPRDFVRVAGPDAATFLQGQISQDIEVLRGRRSAWSFLLQPQGKVDVWMRVSTHGEGEYVLDVDDGFGEAVVARLNRFKLRVKVDIEPLDWHCVAVRGDGAAAIDGLAAEWPGIEGVDVVGPDPAVAIGREGSLDEFERARIEAGVPAMGREITTATIPGELGVNDRTVSFTKGCYTGQELVARVDSRGGNVPRHLRIVRIDGDANVGARVEHEGREVGSLTSAAAGGGGTVALAILARSVDPPADVVVRTDGTELRGHVTAPAG